MNKQRAQEIAASPVMAHVTYLGTPIYIQNVDEQNETARIYASRRTSKACRSAVWLNIEKH